MLERDKVREAIAAAHREGSEYVSLYAVQEALKGRVNSNTVSGQIHYLHRAGELETAPEKLPLGYGQRPVTAYRLGSITELSSSTEPSSAALEVHLASGWRKFDQADAYSIEDGTLSLFKVDDAGTPSTTAAQVIAVFPRGGWQGLLVGRARQLG